MLQAVLKYSGYVDATAYGMLQNTLRCPHIIWKSKESWQANRRCNRHMLKHRTQGSLMGQGEPVDVDDHLLQVAPGS